MQGSVYVGIDLGSILASALYYESGFTVDIVYASEGLGKGLPLASSVCGICINVNQNSFEDFTLQIHVPVHVASA